MSIGARRKSVVENLPAGSKIRPTHRRPPEGAILHVRKVNAAELGRRKFLHLAASAAALAPVPRTARAQAYPTRPITMIVPYTGGSQIDAVARVPRCPRSARRLHNRIRFDVHARAERRFVLTSI
jgi:hypothetical protein